MLDSKAESKAILKILDRYCQRCRELARAEGIDVQDPDALHQWVRAQLDTEDRRSPNDVVTRAIDALVVRDANWHAIDYEHVPLERYAWDLVAEIVQSSPDEVISGIPKPVEWYAVVGQFDVNRSTYEVRIPGVGEDAVPHMQVAWLQQPALPSIRIALFRPNYLPNGLHHWELDALHREALVAFLREPSNGPLSPTCWELATELWAKFHRETPLAKTMPAYEWLRYDDLVPGR